MLREPNATITIGTESAVDYTQSRSQKLENRILVRGTTAATATFTSPLLVKQISANDLHKVGLAPTDKSGGAVHAGFLPTGTTLPDWVKTGSKVSILYDDGDRFAGQLHIRRGRTAWAKKNELGPNFFVSEIAGG
jgi:hypothetical protein